ncbi:MAG: hypothetical protein DDG60_06280 [Anaerolineae bacterium]|nr:MAG: hypothetical protein DDG60_06280 [Anaerolineae bacterium]
MLSSATMKPQKNHSLVASGLFVLIFAAQFLFLIPYPKIFLFADMPEWVANVLGAAFFLHGILLISSKLFNAPAATQSMFNLAASTMLMMIAWTYFQFALFIESFVLAALGLAFFLCNWMKTRREWLIVILQWVNLGIGIGLLWHPEFLLTAPVYHPLRQMPILLAIVFVGSALVSLAMGWLPAFYGGKAGRFLALPWLLWILAFVPSFELPNIGVAMSVGVPLMLHEFIPWQWVIMRQGMEIGRRFFVLVALSQAALLVLMTWAVRYIELNLGLQVQEIRYGMLIVFNFMGLLSILTVVWINFSINGAFAGLAGLNPQTQPPQPKGFLKRLAHSMLEPFQVSQAYIGEIVQSRRDYEALLAQQLAAERRRVAQLSLLHDLNRNLEVVLDPPVAAQLTVNAVQNALAGSLVVVLRYDEEREEMVVLAASGPNASQIPPGYRQSISVGIIGRTARLRRTQLASDTHLDPDYFRLDGWDARCELVVPLLHHHHLRGVILVDHPEANYFDDSDIRTLETVAIQLVTSWLRSEHDQRLTNLINAGISLSTTLDVESVIQQVAQVAQKTLEAQFTFVALVDQVGGFNRTAHVGYAPILLEALATDPGGNHLIQSVLNSTAPVRLRDVRKRFSSTPTGSNELRSLLAVSIRLRQSAIGAILAFGKQGGNSFSESDESLISLLATQSAAAIESTWLYQELRSMLTTATHLYQLSTKILLSEHLADAASAIAETAFQLSKGIAAGIVLLSPEKEVEARVQIDESGVHPGSQHPMTLINDALEHGQTIITSGPNNTQRICLPLQTPRRQYGALWIQVDENQTVSSRFSDTMRSLANQAAIALERGILLVETRKQAEQLEAAYRQLELTYDQTLRALSSALDARDRETEGHSLRVSRLATELGKRVGLTPEQAKVMERGAILHDIGKIGISDTILLKPGPLTPDEWETMRLHPDIGARIIEGIPFLKDALPVIRYHQERWDGSGYPIGLKGYDIPLMARIFAVVDAFDALTSERPYRKPIAAREAVQYLRQNAGILFDPDIVEAFADMVEDDALNELFE